MSKPRADFNCRKCGQLAGADGPIRHEDLPVDSLRCPYTGAKRGFTRLFDAVNIGSGKGRETDKILEANLEPTLQEHSNIKAGSARHAAVMKEGEERTYEKATPKQREQMAIHHPPGKGALGMVPGESRQSSRTLNYPALTGKRVQPIWQR